METLTERYNTRDGSRYSVLSCVIDIHSSGTNV